MQKRYHSGMNFRHLRAFVAIADHGGFARAAARLNLSQPALSRQIRALETDLGTPLFDRIGRRVQLTSEGEDLLQRSRRLLAESEALIERARTLKSGETGILRIGATPHVIENLLAPFLVAYGRKHPGVEVHLVEDGGGRLNARLHRGDVHLMLGATGGSFASRLLYPMHAMAALSPAHRLARHATLEVTALADEPLLVLRRGFASRDWFDAACSMGHVRQHVLLESAAPHTLVALAATGYGVAIVPSNAQVPRKGIRTLPLVHRGASVGRWAIVAWDPARALPPYALYFIEEIVAHCRRSYPGHHLVRRAPRLPQPSNVNGRSQSTG